MHVHTLTRTEEKCLEYIHRYGWIIFERARTRTHQQTTMFAPLLIGIGAMLVACLIHCLLLGLVHTSHRCVFFSPRRRITYPTCPHRRTIFHNFLCSKFVHFEDSFVHPFVWSWSATWNDEIVLFFFASKSKLNGKYECKAPAYLNIIVCCLVFYLVKDFKGLVGDVLPNSCNFYAPNIHPTR